MVNKQAFTLAETLIVMGIIGVVAALTLPNLNSSTGDKEKVAKVKKIYSNLNDAFGRAEAVCGSIDQWFINDSTNSERTKRAGERITEFMKISKTCGLEKNKGCFSSKGVGYANGKSGADSSIDSSNTVEYSYMKYILADGTSFAVFSCGVSSGGDAQCGVLVDIDGPNKGKNSYNVDIFQFYLDNDGLEPESACSIEDDYGSCTDWVLRHGNMDYLKADKNHKCPDGKTILDGITNTTCK
ncbi:type II secretion system protein [bacterium]|nr:type II secretion system protein [bacterium]